MRFSFAAFVLIASSAAAAEPIPLADLYARDQIGEIALSPTGDYIALTVPRGDRTSLLVLRRADLKPTASIDNGEKRHILDIRWVRDDRLVYTLGERVGRREAPSATGELLGVDFDGSDNKPLVGFYASMPKTVLGQMRAPGELLSAQLIDAIDDDSGTALIGVTPWNAAVPYTRVARMNVDTGRHREVARAPVAGASFATDHQHAVRFAYGTDSDLASKLYHRADDASEWALLNDQNVSGRIVTPLGFSADGRVAYLRTDHERGPDSIQTFDPATGAIADLLRDDDSDPDAILYSPFDDSPYGVVYMDGAPRVEYFDAESEFARLHRALQRSFPDQQVRLLTATRDRSLGLLFVFGDRNPGDVYLFDYATKNAQLVMSYGDRLDVDALVPMQPVALKARDGLPLHGYLTRPAGAERDLPLVVMPHGGPFGVRDAWGFDADVQMLANRGYAVLQVNFRGSGGYGTAFEKAGHAQWGGTMQDDVTDATRWAIEQGIADPKRICVYGASYGAYAALMGAVREPGLYRCAIGQVGVYDLTDLLKISSAERKSGRGLYLERTIGTQRAAERSPVNLADKIEIPVLLTAGRKDPTAPVEHTEQMIKAIEKAGGDVTSKLYPTEAHGLYRPENRVDHAERVLAFLERHIGKQAE